jgi:hypothetical protein
VGAVRSVRVAALVSAAVLALTGCTGDDESGGPGAGAAASAQVNTFEKESAEQVLAKAKQAAQDARSVRMIGAFDEGGNSLRIDMVLSDADGGHGSITIDGDKMELRQVGADLFVKGTEEVWSSMVPGAAEAAARLDGKWVRISKDDDAAARFRDIASIDKAFEGLLQPSGKKLTKVKGKDVASTPTVGLLDQGDNADQAATLYIATRGPAYPLLVEPKQSKGKVEFRDWNKPVKVEKPTDGTVDLSSVLKG